MLRQPMWNTLGRLFNRIKSAKKRDASNRIRPEIVNLEQRLVPATFTLTGTSPNILLTITPSGTGADNSVVLIGNTDGKVTVPTVAGYTYTGITAGAATTVNRIIFNDSLSTNSMTASLQGGAGKTINADINLGSDEVSSLILSVAQGSGKTIVGTMNPSSVGSTLVTINESNVRLVAGSTTGFTLVTDGANDVGILISGPTGVSSTALAGVYIDGITVTDNGSGKLGIGAKLSGKVGNFQITNSFLSGIDTGILADSTSVSNTSVNNIGLSDLSGNLKSIINYGTISGIAARGNYFGVASSNPGGVASSIQINQATSIPLSAVSALNPSTAGPNNSNRTTVGFRAETYRGLNDSGVAVGELGVLSGSNTRYTAISNSSGTVANLNVSTNLSGWTDGQIGNNQNTTAAVYDINNNGTSVGALLQTISGVNQFNLFRDPATGSTTYLSSAQLADYTVLANRAVINSTGAVAVSVFNKKAGAGYSIPVIWNADGTITEIAAPETAVANPFGVGAGLGINNSGVVVGTYLDSGSSRWLPFKYDPAISSRAQFLAIASISNGNNVVADIDNTGRILGAQEGVVANSSSTSAIGYLPWISDTAGATKTSWTGGLAKTGSVNWLYNIPMAMNESGQAVGFSADRPGQPFSWANNTNSEDTDAWYWDYSTSASTTPVNLQTILNTVDNARFNLQSATDINANKQITVNYKWKEDTDTGYVIKATAFSAADSEQTFTVSVPSDGRLRFSVGQKITIGSGTTEYIVNSVAPSGSDYVLTVSTPTLISVTPLSTTLKLTFATAASYSMLLNYDAATASGAVDYSSFYGTAGGASGTVRTKFIPSVTTLGVTASGAFYGTGNRITSAAQTFAGSGTTLKINTGNYAVSGSSVTVAPALDNDITYDASATNIQGISQVTYGLGNNGSDGIITTTFLGSSIPFTTVAGANGLLGMNVARFPGKLGNDTVISDGAGTAMAYLDAGFTFDGNTTSTSNLTISDTATWANSDGVGTFALTQSVAPTQVAASTSVTYTFAGKIDNYFLNKSVSMVRTIVTTPTTFTGTITSLTPSGSNTTVVVTFSAAPGAGTGNDSVTLSAPALVLTTAGNVDFGPTTTVLVTQLTTYGDLNAATGGLALVPASRSAVVLMNASSPVELGSGPIVIDRSVTMRGLRYSGTTTTAINYPGDITVQGSSGSGTTNGTIISSANVPLFIGASSSPGRLIINPGTSTTTQGGSLINNATSLYGPNTSDIFLQSVTGGFNYAGDTVSLSSLTQQLVAAGVTTPTVNIFAASGVTVSAMNLQRNQIGTTTTYVNDHVVPTNNSNPNFVSTVNVLTSNQALLTDALNLVRTSSGTVNLAADNTGNSPSANYGTISIDTPVTFTGGPATATQVNLSDSGVVSQASTVFTSNNVQVTAAAGTTSLVTTANSNLVGSAQTVAATVASVPATVTFSDGAYSATSATFTAQANQNNITIATGLTVNGVLGLQIGAASTGLASPFTINLTGSSVVNMAGAGSGAFILNANNSNNTLTGSSGDDILNGQNGINTLNGGTGVDTAYNNGTLVVAYTNSSVTNQVISVSGTGTNNLPMATYTIPALGVTSPTRNTAGTSVTLTVGTNSFQVNDEINVSGFTGGNAANFNATIATITAVSTTTITYTNGAAVSVASTNATRPLVTGSSTNYNTKLVVGSGNVSQFLVDNSVTVSGFTGTNAANFNGTYAITAVDSTAIYYNPSTVAGATLTASTGTVVNNTVGGITSASVVTNTGVVDVEKIANFATNNTTHLSVSNTQGTAITSIQATSATAATLISPTGLGANPTVYISGNIRVPSGSYTLTGAGTGTAPFTYTLAATGLTTGTTTGGSAWVYTPTSYTYALNSSAGAAADIPTVTLTRGGVPYIVPVSGTTTVSPFTITLNVTGITGLAGTAPQSTDTIVANNLANKVYGLAGSQDYTTFAAAQAGAVGSTVTSSGTKGVIVTGLNWAGSAVTTGVSSVAGPGNTVVTMSSIPSGLVVNSYVVLGLSAGTPVSRQVLSISGTTFTVANIGSTTATVNSVTPSSQMDVTTSGLDIWAIDGPRANNFSGTAASFYLTMGGAIAAMSVNNSLNSTQMVVLGNSASNTITVADTATNLFIDGAGGDDTVVINVNSASWLADLTYDLISNRYRYGNVFLSNVETISNPAFNSVVALVSPGSGYSQVSTAVAGLESAVAYNPFTRTVIVPYSITPYSDVTFTKATDLYLYAGTGGGSSTFNSFTLNDAGTTTTYSIINNTASTSAITSLTSGVTPTVNIGASSTAATLQTANDLNTTAVAVTGWTGRLSTDTGTAAQITLTVGSTTGIAAGDWITLAGTTADLNGTFQVVASSVTATTFRVAPTAGTAITASAVGYTGATALESSRMGTVSITNNSAVSTSGAISVAGVNVTIPNPGDLFAPNQPILVNLAATSPATISGVNGTWVVSAVDLVNHTLTYVADAPVVTGTTPQVTGSVTLIKDIGTATVDRSLNVSASGGIANTTRVNAVAGTGILVDRSTGGSLNATISGLRFDATTGKALSVTDTGTTAAGGSLSTSRNVVTASNNVFYTPVASTAVESGASEPGVSAVTGNTFFDGLNGTQLTSNYDINDRMLHRMSNSGSTLGLVVWNTGNLYVSSGTSDVNTTGPLARAVGASFAGSQVPTSLLPASYTVNIENTFVVSAPTVYTVGTNNLTIVGDATSPATTTKDYSFAFTATGVTNLTVGGQASFNVTGSAANDTITVATLGGNHTFTGNGGTDNIIYPANGVSADPGTFYTQSTAAGTGGTTNILQNYTLSTTSVTDTFVGISTIGYQTSPPTGVIFVDSSTGVGTISAIKTIEAGVAVSNPGDTIFIRGFPTSPFSYYANTTVNKDNLFMTFNGGISEPGLTPVNLTLASGVQNITIRDGVGALNYSPANVIGNDANNTITGNSGANIITLGKGSDIVVGGLGIDTIILPLSNVNSVLVGSAVNGLITLTYNDGTSIVSTTISGVEALQDSTGGKIAIVTGTNSSTSGGYVADWGSTNPYSTYTNFAAVGGSYASTISVTSASTTISPIVQNAVLSGASRLGTTITGSTTVIASYTAASPVSYGVGDTIVISGYSGADAIFNGTYSVASVAIDKLSFTVSQNVTGPTSAYTAVAGAGNSAISATFASITLTGAGLVNSAAIAGMAGKVATVTIAGSSAANTSALNNALLLVRETSGASTGQITFNNSVAIPYTNAVVNKDLTFQNSGTAPTVASVIFSDDGLVTGPAPRVTFTGTPFTSSTVTLGTQAVATITAASITSNVATITAANHGYTTGDSVEIQGVNTTFNGTYTVAVVNSNSFTYSLTSANVSLTGLAGKTSNVSNNSIFPNAFAVVVGSSVTSPAVRTLTIGSDYVYTSTLTLSNDLQYNAGASDRVISNLTLNSAATLAKASGAGVGNLYASSVNLASGGSLSAAMTLLGTSSGRFLTIGAGTYAAVAGGITVSSGQTLTINGAVNLGATPITVATGGSLVVGASSSLTTTGALTVNGTLTSSGAVTSSGLAVAGTMTSSGAVDGGATSITGIGSLVANGGLTTTTLTLGATGTLTTSSITATGNLVLNNTVTNPGVISASSSTITLAAGRALSTNANITAYAITIPATSNLVLTGTATVTTDASGGLSLAGAGDGINTFGALIVTGTISPTIAGPVSTAAGTTLLVDTAATVTFSGVLTTAGQLNKTGAGRLTLGSAGVNSSEVVIGAGQIRMNNLAALGTGSPTVTVQSGATLELGVVGTYPYTLNLEGGTSTTVVPSVKRVDSSAGLTNLTGAITLGTPGSAGNTTVRLENANATASSPLQYAFVTPANSNVSIATTIATATSPVEYYNGTAAVPAPRFSTATTGASATPMANGFIFNQGSAAPDGTGMNYSGSATAPVNQRSNISSLRVVFDRAVRAEGSNWLNAISLFNVSGSGSTPGQVTIAVNSGSSTTSNTILDISWGGARASLVDGIYSLKINSDKLYDTQSRLRLDIAVGTGATAGTNGKVYDQSRIISGFGTGTIPSSGNISSQNLTGNGNAGGRVTWYEFQRYLGDANGDGIVSGTAPAVAVATAYTINGVASYSDGSFYANGSGGVGTAYYAVFGGIDVTTFNAIVSAFPSNNKPFGNATYPV